MQGLTEEQVELAHLRVIVAEIDREQMVVRSLQEDNNALKEQLQIETQKYASLEAVRDELEQTREYQATRIT